MPSKRVLQEMCRDCGFEPDRLLIQSLRGLKTRRARAVLLEREVRRRDLRGDTAESFRNVLLGQDDGSNRVSLDNRSVEKTMATLLQR